MFDLFLYNAKMDMLRRKVYANVRNILLKHMFITRSFVFITTSGNLLLYSLCYEDNFPYFVIIIRDKVCSKIVALYLIF